MKKLFCLFLVVSLIFASFAFSAKTGAASGDGSGKEVQVEEMTQNRGAETNLTVRERTEAGDSSGDGIGQETGDETGQRLRNETREQERNMSGEQGNGAGQMIRNQSRETLEEQERLRNQTREQLRNDSADMLRNQTREMIRNQTQDAQEIRERIREQSRILNQSLQGLGPLREIDANQNRVRLAVHALLAAEDYSGGIGRDVSGIAREYNNSIEATVRAEERIRTRGGIDRFFFGGDENAAADIEGLVERNRERILQLNTLMNECACGDDIKAVIREQITAMEREQNRLMEMAQRESGDKGLLGWLFK